MIRGETKKRKSIKAKSPAMPGFLSEHQDVTAELQ